LKLSGQILNFLFDDSPGAGPLMTTSGLGILGAFWGRKVIEDTEQIATWISGTAPGNLHTPILVADETAQ
jgi:hypothetical protein